MYLSIERCKKQQHLLIKCNEVKSMKYALEYSEVFF